MAEKDLSQVVGEIPWKNKEVIRGASEWLGRNGIITDFHKNTLVVGIAMESKFIKGSEFFSTNYADVKDADDKIGLLVVVVYVSRLFMIFGNKIKLHNRILSKVSEFLPNYDILVDLKVFKKSV